MPGYAIPQIRRTAEVEETPGSACRQRRPAAVGQSEMLARTGEDGGGAARRRSGSAAMNWSAPILTRNRKSMDLSVRRRKASQVFAGIDPHAPLIVAESVWQYSHHILPGLLAHRGPILTVRQLVGHVAGARRDAQSQRLAHQGGRANIPRSGAKISPTTSSAIICALASRRPRQAQDAACHQVERRQRRRQRSRSSAKRSAEQLQREKAIIGVFDEGCMGMFNAIIPDALLNPLGVSRSG